MDGPHSPNDSPPADGWRVHRLTRRLSLPGLPGLLGSQIRPADVGEALVRAMLDRASLLEDAKYHKVIPNQFIVKLNPETYAHSFQSIEPRLLQQWKEKLMVAVVTANSRAGRKEYHFGGRLRIEIWPVAETAPGEALILYRVGEPPHAGLPLAVPAAGLPGRAAALPGRAAALPGRAAALPLPAAHPAPACLEWSLGGRRWPLPTSGVVSIGRRPGCEIVIDLPDVQSRRLVSGRHAYLVVDGGAYRLFDGSPDGKPSVNGTYVNFHPVSLHGQLLHDGDLIILAAVDPHAPRPDTPGVAALRFRLLPS